MELKIINDNDFGQNVYLYYDKNSGDGVVIDPGDNLENIRQTLAEGINVKAILLTHGHFDHILSAAELRKLTGANIYAHEAEVQVLESPDFNRSSQVGRNEVAVTPDKCFTDGDIFKIGNAAEIKIIHTPGHTGGGVCYYDEKNAVIFTGDTLFKETIGRTDMPTGNHSTLLASIKEKLFTLPENVTVYPGHGESTSISHEKAKNPHF
ncbi:MAG: MBL fold metallo-hydrolase [Defluviitaleaceae bacterium]|nr:MBL fold metallo-hydrolase [Defluviitaleaceae bacterium]